MSLAPGELAERVRRAERDAVHQGLLERIRLEETVGRLAKATEEVKALYGQLDGAYTKIHRLEKELARRESTSY